MKGTYYKTPIDFKALIEKRDLAKTSLETSIDQQLFLMGKESKLFFRSDYYLDNERGKIFGLAHIFIEIDLNQAPPFVTQYGLQEEFEKYNIKKANDTAEDFVVQDNLLYFYLAEQLRFGVLDINTKEIIYVSEPIAVVERDDCFTQLKDLKVSENKVYILDSNHTLHIFEREKLNFELGGNSEF